MADILTEEEIKQLLAPVAGDVYFESENVFPRDGEIKGKLGTNECCFLTYGEYKKYCIMFARDMDSNDINVYIMFTDAVAFNRKLIGKSFYNTLNLGVKFTSYMTNAFTFDDGKGLFSTVPVTLFPDGKVLDNRVYIPFRNKYNVDHYVSILGYVVKDGMDKELVEIYRDTKNVLSNLDDYEKFSDIFGKIHKAYRFDVESIGDRIHTPVSFYIGRLTNNLSYMAMYPNHVPGNLENDFEIVRLQMINELCNAIIFLEDRYMNADMLTKDKIKDRIILLTYLSDLFSDIYPHKYEEDKEDDIRRKNMVSIYVLYVMYKLIRWILGGTPNADILKKNIEMLGILGVTDLENIDTYSDAVIWNIVGK